MEIPKILYHGTNASFKRFNEDFIKYVGCNGDGFYFTRCPKYAKSYGKNVLKCTLQIKNPIYPKIKFLSLKNYIDLLNELFKDNEYKDGLKNYGFFKDEDFIFFAQTKAKELNNKNDDYNAIFDLVHTVTGSVRVIAEKLKKCTGIYFDSVVSETMNEYVVFKPKQINILN